MQHLVEMMTAPPVTPGEILVEDYLRPLGITQTEFAKRIGVTYARLNEFIHGKRGVTTDTALRLSKALGTDVDVWLNLQHLVDLYQAMHSTKGKEIAKIKPILRTAATP